MKLTGIIQKEGSGYVSVCPELDVASQGDTVDEARANLIEAVQLFLEMASSTEIEGRMNLDTHVTEIEVVSA
jgi:predicted RNase H-like HicB family nuclease